MIDYGSVDNREWHSISERLVRDFVCPIVAESERLITSFHFLFEPRLVFRLRCKNEESRKRVKNIIEYWFDKSEVASMVLETKPLQFDDEYDGEATSYGGEDNWQVAEKFLEASSRFYMRTIAGHRGKEFHIWKFIHLLLNCNNHLPPLEEGKTLVESFCERMAYWHTEKSSPLRGALDRATSLKLLKDFFDRLSQNWWKTDGDQER